MTALAKELKITTEGARFQLLKLANEGLVQATTEVKGRGRPQQHWSLSASGHARFPDTHAELTVRLIQTMRQTLGEEAVEVVMQANERSGIERYSAEMQDCPDLESRISRLAEVRSREGYMAEYRKIEEGGYLLIENHCPICAAASSCQRFCSSELNTFRTVLGKNINIERTDHILAGARRCAYRISQA